MIKTMQWIASNNIRIGSDERDAGCSICGEKTGYIGLMFHKCKADKIRNIDHRKASGGLLRTNRQRPIDY